VTDTIIHSWTNSRRPFHDWLAGALECETAEVEAIWQDGQSFAAFPPFERDAVMIAVEMLSPTDRAVFATSSPWDRLPTTFTDVPTSHDTTMRCATFGTYNVVRSDDGEPVMVWLLDGNIDIDVIVTGASVEAREQVIGRIRDLVTGAASPWRGQRVLFDLSKEVWYRHLGPAERPAIDIDPDIATELRRNLVLPLRHYGTDERLVDRRGVLLHGRPGTGKTQALQWVQAEVDGSATIVVTTPTMFGGAIPMKNLFEFVAAGAPSLVVLEDVDLALTSRAMSPIGNDALGELLQFMDGPAKVHGAFVAATTNHPKALDSALIKRPGRFDRKIEVANATREARMQMVTMLLARIGDDRSSADTLADRTDGWSLAELDEAAHLAVLTSFDTGEPVDLNAALDLVHRNERGTSKRDPDNSIGYV